MKKIPKKPLVPDKAVAKKSTGKEDSIILRTAAEKRLDTCPHAEQPISSIQDTLHDLEVHQIELEMQNEELRQAQSVIEASRERYIDFYDFAPVGYLTLDSNGRLDEINLTGAGMLGEERNKILHHNFTQFIVPEYHDRWGQLLTDILHSDKKLTSEMTIVRRGGSRLHVQLDCLRLPKQGEAAVIRIAMSDITARIQAEDAIREQEEFFRLITENIEDFIAVLDLEGRRLYNSPSYARLVGNVGKLTGTDSFAEIHPDDRDRVKQVFRETVESGTGLKIEYRFVLADGSIRNLESQGTLIRNRQGQPSRVVVISRDITERKLTEEKIRNQAYFDSLTRLPNRRMLDDRMHQAMAASKRSGHYCGLLFLDLDNFKPLNDRYGHGAGDMLLLEVAQRIASCVREMDTVARFGGDEFVVMLSELGTERESSSTQARNVAEKILAAIARPYNLRIRTQDNSVLTIEHQCTASIGAVIFFNHENNPDELLNLADKTMYKAKHGGRNRICLAHA